MSLRHDTPAPIEQCDAENVSSPRLRSAILRKRIKAIFGIVLMALVYSIYFFYRSAYLRNAGDWSLFWIGEVFVGAYIVYAVTQVFKKKSKL